MKRFQFIIAIDQNFAEKCQKELLYFFEAVRFLKSGITFLKSMNFFLVLKGTVDKNKLAQ